MSDITLESLQSAVDILTTRVTTLESKNASLQTLVDDTTSETKKFDSRLVDIEIAIKQLNGNDSQLESAYTHLRAAMEQFSHQANSNEIAFETLVCWLAGYKPGDYQKDLTMLALNPDAPKNEPMLRPRNNFDSKTFFELMREIGRLAMERKKKQIEDYMRELEQKASQKGGLILPNGQKLEIQQEGTEDNPVTEEQLQSSKAEAVPAQAVKPNLTLVK
jgi:chaperonin cofactor prefoldin